MRQAQAALAEFLLAPGAGGAAELDLFCAAQGELGPLVRALHADWERVRGVFERLHVARSFQSRLRERWGEGIDPGISLDRDSLSRPGAGEPLSRPGAPEGGDRSEGGRPATSGRLLDRIASQPSAGATRYLVRGEIARGGMGVIQKVWDENLRRTLARKVMLPSRRAADDESTDPNASRVSRFLEEAQITGQLDHPCILPVHEVGIDEEGRPYFAMPLVKGRDFKEILEHVLRGEQGWTRPRALGVILKVCEAMAFAHSKGVIHRDLKPANIMVGRFGETYVMDWGLAKVLGREETRDLRVDATSTLSIVRTDRKDEAESDPDSPIVTMDGDVVGTPAYMAPEQAQGRTPEIGPQADVYSVGAMLYHLLTGQMPYVPLGERVSPHTVLNAVRNGPPWAIRDVAKDVPEELAAICDKAMARSLEARYGDMMAMAEDLRAFLEGRVVRAYETGAVAEFRKWVVRNKAMALAIGLAILAVIGGLGIAVGVRTKANAELSRANEEISRKHREALESGRKIAALKEQSDEMARRALEEKERADEYARRVSDRAYQSSVLAADYSLRLAETERARKALAAADEERRGWEWAHLALKADGSIAQLAGFAWQVPWVAFHEGGARFSALDVTGLWVEYEVDGVREVARRELAPYVQAAALGRRHVAFYSGEEPVVRVLDPRTGAVQVELEEPEARSGIGGAGGIAMDAAEARLAALVRTPGFLGSTLRVWDLTTGKKLADVAGLPPTVGALAFAPDGRTVATADRTVRLWSADEGTLVRVLPGPDEAVSDLAFSPSGEHLAVAYEDGTIQTWDAERGEVSGVMRGHIGAVTDVAFSGDGRRIVSAGADGTVRVWSADDASALRTLLGHGSRVLAVAADADGTHVVSGEVGQGREETERRVRLWVLDVAEPVTVLAAHKGPVHDAAFDGAGARLVSAGADGRAVVWDARSGEVQNVLRGHGGPVTCVDIDGAGRRIATGSDDGTVLVWSAESGQPQSVLDAHGKPIECLGFDPSGRLLATGARDRRVMIWDAADGTLVRELPRTRKRVLRLAFSPDGARLAVAADDKAVAVWDVATGAAAGRCDTGHEWRITGLAWTPDGERLYTSSLDRSVRSWDAATGAAGAVLALDGGPATDVGLSPDGARLVVATSAGEVHVVDVRSLELLLSLRGPEGQATSARFDPAGERLLSTSGDGSVRLWETGPALERHRARQRTAELRRRAEPFVERLYDRHRRMHAVLSVLQFDRSLTNEVRRAAIALTRVRGDDPEAFRRSAWSLVRSPDASPAERELGLDRARAALELHAELESEEPLLPLLVTRGIARYRTGDYAGARTDLAGALERSREEDDLLPRILAFLAMVEHRLERDGDARAALERLRDRRGRPSWWRDPHAEELLREAEALLGAG